MNGEKAYQLELFGQYPKNTNFGNSTGKDSPQAANNIRVFQKIVISFIGLVVISLISFSLGVERGKNLAITSISYQNKEIESLNTADNIKAVKPPVAAVIDQGVTVQDKGKKNTNKEENFTVQVASISKQKNIKTFLNKLSKKGHTAFSLVKGKYRVVCIGKFNQKEDAKVYLERIKSDYPGSIVRRL